MIRIFNSLFWYLFIFLLLGIGRVFAVDTPVQVINMYVYHLKPPFIVDRNKQQGLYYDFADYLNNKSDKYHFETIFIPRRRIEKMIKDDEFDGVLLGVNPVWFKDKSETKYLWTSNFYQDRDEVVSHCSEPMEYEAPSSFEGKIVGGVRGFYYFGLNELVTQGKVKRQDTIGEPELLTMLAYKRVDAAIISRSTFDYLTKETFDRNLFHLSAKPHDQFERRILVPRNNVKIYNHLEDMLKGLSTDPLWLKTLVKYNY